MVRYRIKRFPTQEVVHKWRHAEQILTNFHTIPLLSCFLLRLYTVFDPRPLLLWFYQWSIKEYNQAPAIIDLAWLWHHFNLSLDGFWTHNLPTVSLVLYRYTTAFDFMNDLKQKNLNNISIKPSIDLNYL